MQQKWWLFAVGAVGIALFVLLFPKPATDDLPSQDLTRQNPLDFKGDNSNERSTKAQTIRHAQRAPRNPQAVRVPASRHAGNEHLLTPEAIFSGRLSGPWTLVRRQLLANGDDAAKEWAEEITPVVVDLRARRRDPKAVEFDELRARQDALLAHIRSQPGWLEVEGVAAQVDRIDDLFAGYDEARLSNPRKTMPLKTPDEAPAAEPAPAPAAPPAGGQ